MKPELTIIIPCYNCASTLSESVNSCFEQGLNSFEIVMVNDASTDNTQELIESLAAKHKEIRFFRNDTNLGGGATRNRAVQESWAEVIFCLDSDDVLPKDTLPKMLSQLKATKADGVHFEGGLSFKDSVDTYKKYTFETDPSSAVTIDDFFGGKVIGVTVNFMYTKEAHTVSGGYPTHHNFDTQGYGVRFLMSGLKAYTCKDTFFYHRQFSGPLSYFERTYNSGEFSLGHSYILLDTFHILSKKVQNQILDFDVFTNNKLDKKDIFSNIIKSYRDDSATFFKEDYKKYISPTGLQDYLADKESSEEAIDLLVKAHSLWRNLEYSKSVACYNDYLLVTKTSNRFIYFLIFHAMISQTNTDKRIMYTQNILRNMLLNVVSTDTTRPSFAKRAARKLIRTINKYLG